MRNTNLRELLVRIDTNVKKVLIAAVVLALPLVLSGCIGGLGVGGGTSNPQGEFVQGGVVKGFPPVPIYPKAQVAETYGNGNVFGASLVSSDSLTKVLDFYNKNLAAGGWEANLAQTADTNYVFTIKNASYQGEVIVNTASDNKKTAITVNLNKR